MAKAMAEKVSTGIFIAWLVMLFIAFLPVVLVIALLNSEAARYFFCGLVAGPAVYLAFFA